MTLIMKPTIQDGQWVQRPATEIDGQHPYATGNSRDERSKPMAKRPQTVTMRLNKDGTMSMRSTGGFDLRKVLAPEATARLESRDTKQTDRAPVREGRT